MVTNVERERCFMQTLWQNRLIGCRSLTLTNSDEFEIVSVGIRNESGDELPDFSFAALHYTRQNVTLYGSIKIDTHSSHWREQGTVNAPGFSSVILHVVLCQDIVISQNGRDIPTLVMQIPPIIATRYDQLRRGTFCAPYFGSLDPVHTHHILTRVMSDRLKRKSDEILAIFDSVEQNWHETAYISFVRAFGFREKKHSFETLARTLPLRFIRLHSNSPISVEALILGLAGYLDIPDADQYTRQLQNEYAELRHRHNLNPRQISWRGSAVRPGSLPVQSLVRIAAILTAEEQFLDRILRAENGDELVSIFDKMVAPYWQTHIAPSRQATMGCSSAGRQKNELLIINFVIPFLTTYSIVTANEELRDRAIDLYESLPAEDNRYTRQWSAGGYKPESAFFSQALIQLSSEYCTDGLCGSCPLGAHILGKAYSCD